MEAKGPTTNESRFSLPTLFPGLRGVERAQLPTEILAGVTLAALMIPLNIGYAQVAGLPAEVGLYAAILPCIAYAIFATSRNVVASPDAAIAALIGSLLAPLAMIGEPRYIELALALALLCSVFFFLFWLFRLGYLANFLSKAVLIGFISGLGIEVLLGQIEKIMGVSVEVDGFFREAIALIGEIPQANWYSVALGVSTIAIIRLLKRYAPKLPGALIALIALTIVVGVFDLTEVGVTVLGPVPPGIPEIRLPDVALSDYLRLIPGAIAICAITMAEGLLIARKYAQTYDYKIDGNQESFAYGAANVASGLSGGLAVGVSASRSAAMDSMGSRSQIPSVVAAIAVLIVIIFFTDLLAELPNAVLGGIVANAVIGLIEVAEFRELYHMRRSEFWIALICLLCVLVLGAIPAVVIAFLLSAVELVGRMSRPQTAVLTESPTGDGFSITAGSNRVQSVPGLAIYRFGGPIIFANANTFSEQVAAIAGHEGEEPLDWFVLDAEAIIDVDTTGADALEHAIELFDEKGIVFAMSRASDELLNLLTHYGLMEDIDEAYIFANNREALRAFYAATGRKPTLPGDAAAIEA